MENEKGSVGIFPMVADLLHAGHLLALKEARKYCDVLIVALNVDPSVDSPSKHKPIESVYERYIRLESCKYVDRIIPYCGEEDLLLLIQTVPHDTRFVGADHKDKDFTGKDFEESHGIDHVYIDREHNLSSSSLRQRVVVAEKG